MNEPALLAALCRQAVLLTSALAMLALARPALKRLGAGTLYAVWLLVPALLLTPALPRPAQEPLRLALQAAGQAATAHSLPQPAAPPDLAAVWLSLWLWLWLAGAAVVAGVQVRRQWRLARLGSCLPAGSSPALVGLLRPRLALPADFEQRFPPAQRELILAHEQVHRERLDNLWNLLACVLAALHWWNPLAWWAARRFRADQELACDAAVLAPRPEVRADYTQALLAAHDLHSLGAPLASRWGTTHPLVERIAMLHRPHPSSRRRAAALGLALLGVAGLAYAVQTAPAPPAATAPLIRLKGSLIYQDGEFVRRSSLDFEGHSGEPTHVVIGGAQTKVPDVSAYLVATALDEKRLQIEMSFEGLPADLKTSRPRMVLYWGAPGTLESIDAKTTRRLTVFVVGIHSDSALTTADQAGSR